MIHERRQSGRTTRQLAELPAGAIYVIPTAAMESYCQRILYEVLGRDPSEITFVPLRRAARSVPTSLDGASIDHACYTVGQGPQRRANLITLERIIQRRKL